MGTKKGLKPFLDAGFTHDDRKKRIGQIRTDNNSEIDGRAYEKIMLAKNAFEKGIENVAVHELESLLMDYTKLSDHQHSDIVY